MQIVDRVEVVKNEHEKLEGGNKFLQSYVPQPSGPQPVTNTAQIYWRAHANEQAHLCGRWKSVQSQGQGQNHQITISARAHPYRRSELTPSRYSTQAPTHHGRHSSLEPSLPRNHDGLLPHILTTMASFQHTNTYAR
jgi:hypothetical protein